MSIALLQTTYFGPIQWYQKLNRYDQCLIERFDSYQKQTYRNRCVIATANGLQALTVPVEHNSQFSVLDGQWPKANGQLVKDLRVSDHNQWRRVHWNALQSAYSESPFFEYYADDIRPFFVEKWNRLFDYNMAITQKMLSLIGIEKKIGVTDSYKGVTPIVDDIQLPPYYQTFQRRYDFLPDMSILDLLFNEGPESMLVLNLRK